MQGARTPNGIIYHGSTVPALCLDLDGTIRHSKKAPKGFIDGPDDVALFSDVEAKLWEYRNRDYLIFGMSNQAGVAFGFKDPTQVEAEIDATFQAFEKNPFHCVQQCYHHPEGKSFPFNKRSLLRKPDTGMLVLCEIDAFENGFLVDWDNSLFVGDRPEDEECARNARIPFQWAWEFFGRERVEV